MSKKSFNDIEHIIKTAAEAHNPAFDEESWRKMEALLDKDKDRRRPFFWIWWLLPLLIGAGVVAYFSIAGNEGTGESATVEKLASAKENNDPAAQLETKTNEPAIKPNKQGVYIPNGDKELDAFSANEIAEAEQPAELKKSSAIAIVDEDIQKSGEKKHKNRKRSSVVKGKVKVAIIAPNTVSDMETADDLTESKSPVSEKNNSDTRIQEEENVVVNINSEKAEEKEVERIIDSVLAKKENDKKSKSRPYRFYVIAAAGAEGSGVKLFSADKLTGRVGIAVGYQLNKKLSVQSGFFISNKKYIAGASDYKIRSGSYWSLSLIHI